MKKAQVGASVEEPSKKQQKRLKKSLKGVQKGYKPTSGPSFKYGGAKKSLAKAQDGREVGKPVLKDKPTAPPKSVQNIGPRKLETPQLPNPYSDTSQKQATPPTKREERKKEREDRRYDRLNAKRVKKGYKSLSTASFKTGGMVNSNAKISADKTAGSKGVKSGVNPKASSSKVAKGRVGGTNKSVARPKK
jgi:hypothetical protein